MSAQVAWSYSRLASYETCPRKFWAESVGKTVPFVKSEQAAYGDEVHLAFKDYFKSGTPLPLHLRHFEKIIAPIAKAPGVKSIEQKICLNASWEVVDWFAKDAYLRVISDLTQLNGTHGVLWDWKTGKPKDDFTQLRLNAAVTFHLAPEIQTATVAFLWLQTKKVAPLKMVRADATDVWAELLPRVAKYQEAHVKQDFPPRQNFLCRGWCQVSTCQFWEKKR